MNLSASSADGRVEAIWIKRSHRGPMDRVDTATLVVDRGLADSVDRSRRRQVTLLSREAWDQCMTELGADADPAHRRANILVSGLELGNTRGRILVIGDARLAIGGELTPCERMDEVVTGLQEAMRPDWRGGVFAQVIAGGIVRIGDRIAWESVPAMQRAR